MLLIQEKKKIQRNIIVKNFGIDFLCMCEKKISLIKPHNMLFKSYRFFHVGFEALGVYGENKKKHLGNLKRLIH